MAFDPQEVVDFIRQVNDAESTNRVEAQADLSFSAGNQWPADVQSSRQLEARPCLTINKVDAYIRQVTNSQRQQRPRMKAHPVDSIADPKIAEVITGLCRHIEVNSDADEAYDTAFDYAVRMGWGYWRVLTDYTREDSFDQDIYIQSIQNPFTVYFDNNSVQPDGSDAEKCSITDKMRLDAFKRSYPGAQESGFEARGTGDYDADWVTKDDIRIAEYFRVEKEKQKLVMLSDKTIVWADKMPPAALLDKEGISVVGDRDSFRRVVEWKKVTAFETLEEKKWIGRWIPVVPVYGTRIYVDGKRQTFGLTRFAKDPQQMYNFWRTAMTESVALAPKAKWLMAEGQDEGHELEWSTANISARPLLRYKVTDIGGKAAPAPERIQPEPPPSGAMESAMAISNDLQAVLGIFDPAMGIPSGPKSGKAIRAEQGQSEQSNYHFYDNLTRSIKHTGRIILDLVPKIYDQQRVSRIIGEDGKPDLVTLNQPEQKADETGKAIETVLNDVTVGEYDIVMEVGPGFNSKREESVMAMTEMTRGNPDLWKIAGDLIFRNMDFPGADVIADRLAAANPLAQIDEKSDIPPAAQMMIKQLQQQLQGAQQQMQAMGMELKTKAGLQQIKEEGATKREMIKATVKAHETEIEDAGWKRDVDERAATARHDTEVKALTAQNVEELRGMVQLMLKHIDGKQLALQAERADAEAIAKANEAEPQI